MVAYAFIAAAFYAVTLLAYELWRGPRIRAPILRLKCERNRDRFGELRTELMRLARDGEIELRSGAFAALYRSLTILMRSPSDYPTAVRFLLRSFSPAPAEPLPVTPREGKLLVEFANRLDALCRDFDATYRLFARCMDLANDGTARAEFPPLLHLFIRRHELIKLKSVQKARARLIQFGGGNLAVAGASVSIGHA